VRNGIALQLLNTTSRNVDDAVNVFKQSAPGFLKEMAIVVGNHWLNEQLSKFEQWNDELIKQLSLTEIFVVKGG